MVPMPQLHAALNDFPPALFVAAMGFYIAALITKKDGLRHAAHWSIVGAAIGAVLALVTGLRAEAIIEHGSVMHRSIERHQTLAIGFTVLAIALATWSTLRRHSWIGKERITFGVMSFITLVTVYWTSSVGGRIVFRHAGGITTDVLRSAIVERNAGHQHADGEDHEHEPTTVIDSSAAAVDSSHSHPAGTPEHSH